MTDDAPSNNPDPAGKHAGEPPAPDASTPPGATTPPPFQPDKTVRRPKPEGATGAPPPPPAEETRVVPSGDVLVHDDPATDTAGWGGGDAAPPATAGADDPDFPTRATKAGTAAAVVALGTGLLGAAVAIAATRARADGDLDWSNYGVGLGATVVLLAIAVLGAVAARTAVGRAREEAITWPGVVGILATAVMVGVGINKSDKWVDYLIGAIIVVLALVGYLLARRGAFAVVGIVGLGLLYGRAFDDLFGDSIDGENGIVTIAIAIAVFVVAVTVLGWLLPSRALIGVSVGVVGVVGYAGLLVALLAIRFIGAFFGPMMMSPLAEPGGEVTVDSGFKESDVWWILVLGGVLTLLWALAASITNHPGFTVLAIVMPTILVPLGTVALAAERPSLWAGILAAAGGVLLIGAVGLARLRGRKVGTAGTA